MKPVTVAKAALALSGLATYAVGMRLESATVKWTGIGLVAVAFLLRFVKDQGTN